jgi:hypothetical protein
MEGFLIINYFDNDLKKIYENNLKKQVHRYVIPFDN